MTDACSSRDGPLIGVTARAMMMPGSARLTGRMSYLPELLIAVFIVLLTASVGAVFAVLGPF